MIESRTIMKIAILSRGPRLYSTRRLKEACERRGHEAKVLNPLQFTINLEVNNPTLLYKSKRIPPFDAVIPRIGASITFFGTAVVRQFEQMGVFSVASSQAITVSRDKLRSLQILSRHRIGLPKTTFVRWPDGVLPAIERMGGCPIVIKLLEGTQGIGVILAETEKAAQAIVETLQGPGGKNVLLQQFVKESHGRDIRAVVVGGEVVAAMRRKARAGDFRSNVHRGGKAERVELDPEYARTAVQAAQILGLRVAGVDMLEGKDGPLLIEVNSSPGLEGIETATGIDVADAIVRLIEDEVLFPEIDIRQRLTLKSGYGILEIPVDDRSELVGRTLRDSRLRDRDIVVLSILRGEISIPNPGGSRQILAGDVLLCFGKTLSLKALARKPSKKRRPRTLRSHGSHSTTPVPIAGAAARVVKPG
jgi:ribosomal protein S6--L-glutamate ligase